jgi:hypothetical protein
MKNFVSYSIVLDADGMESLSTGTSNDVVDRPIRSIEDVKAIEQELIIKYTPMMKVLGTEIVSLSIITWRPFDE